MAYQDKAGHFTTKENDGGECRHNLGEKKENGYAAESVAALTVPQKEYRQNTPYEQIIGKKQAPKTKTEFFGMRYTGVKGIDAVNLLLKERQGHVKGAFYRKEIGDIDLVWGDENGGLAHVIKRRDEIKGQRKGTISGIEMAKKIPEIVASGDFYIDKLNRPCFEQQGCRVAIKPNYDGERVNWVVSAMEIL